MGHKTENKRVGRKLRNLHVSAGILFLLCMLSWSFAAQASEYPLESVSFLKAKEVKALNKLPAKTTHEAGKALAEPKARKKAAKKISLSKTRLNDLARLFDLLRIKGLGPRMALLFSATKIWTCEELAKQDAEALAKQLMEVNSKEGIANKVPDAAMLKDWIAQAGALPRQYVSAR